MNASLLRVLSVVCLATLLGIPAQAPAELAMSVTISGPIGEVLPLLQQLREQGYGAQAPAAEGGGMKLEIHSEAAGAPEPPPEPPKPALALAEPAAEPATARPGDTVRVMVRVSDPDHVVDTLAATNPTFGETADLFDNGTHGDAAAGDGIWTAAVVLNRALAPGEYPIVITAYNANGVPVTVPGSEGMPVPLSCQTLITVQAGGAPAEPPPAPASVPAPPAPAVPK